MNGLVTPSHRQFAEKRRAGFSRTWPGSLPWQGGQLLDLNELVQPGSGLHLTHATAISDSGCIVGRGEWNGKSKAVLLKPR